jgi:hypothetical protein
MSMVWVVIDTNQAIRMAGLPQQYLGAEIEGITLPPFVLAELLRSNNHQPLARLAQYAVRIGMTPGEVMARLAPLRRSQIVAFHPFHDLTTQKVHEFLLSPPVAKAREFMESATTHISTGGQVLKAANEKVRQALRSQGRDPRQYKFSGMAHVCQVLAHGRTSVLETWLMQFVSEGGIRDVRANSRALYTGAMANPYLRHYLHTFLWYTISYQQAWTSQYADWNLSIKQNDWTDMTLALYAGPGDIILTNDGTVRKAVSAVNPDDTIKVASTMELDVDVPLALPGKRENRNTTE